MDSKTLRYAGDYGQTQLIEAHEGERRNGAQRLFRSASLSVAIEPKVCADAMSGQRYRDTVVVVAKGQTLNGCGGAPLPPESLGGTNWQLFSVNDKDVGANAAVLFFKGDGSLAGRTGCNTIGAGTYSIAGEQLSGSAVITQMACEAPRMEQERHVIDALTGPSRIRYDAEGRLVLTTPKGARLAFKRYI